MNAHDVRKLAVCGYCQKVGIDLIKSRHRRAHASCVVERCGFDKLAALPNSELAKITVDDFIAMGFKTISDFNAKVQQSRSASEAHRLRLAAIEFGKHIGEEPIDDADSECSRRNDELLAAAKAYAFADVEQRIVKLLLEDYETDDDKEDAKNGRGPDYKSLAKHLAEHLKGEK